MSLLIIVSLFNVALSQGCGNDVLVDDFSTAQNKFFDNADRAINKLGGDYGTDGRTQFMIDTAEKTLTVIPAVNGNESFFYAKYVRRN